MSNRTRSSARILGLLLILLCAFDDALGQHENRAIPVAAEGAREALRCANADITALPGDTAYQKIKNAFNLGTAPSQEDLEGYWAGRNFYCDEQDRPYGAYMYSRLCESIPNGGPLFSRHLKIVIHGFPDPRADVAAVDTLFSDRRKELEEEFAGFSRYYSFPQFGPTCVSVRCDRISSEMSVRKYGQMLVVWHCVRDAHGWEIHYSYYFLHQKDAR